MLNENGFIFLEQFELESNTITVANKIGIPVSAPNIPIVQRLTPKRIEESTQNLYSGNFGLGRFPLHSDLSHWYIPPRYLMLRCISSSDTVFTGVVKTINLLKEINISDIERAIFKPRKRQNGKLSLLKFKQKTEYGDIYRWDSIFLNPSNKSAELICDSINNADKNENFCKKYLQQGDILLLDNWNTLHCRSEINLNNMSRIIERVYLSEIVI